jgi:S1-C subfamily serine protease
MDRNYYFVNEPGSGESGPYEPREILRAIAVGQISREATVCRMGDASWLPITHDEAFAAALAPPPPRPASGTTPPRVRVSADPPPPPMALALALRPPTEPPMPPPLHLPSPPPSPSPSIDARVAPAPGGSRRRIAIAVGVGAVVLAAAAVAVVAARSASSDPVSVKNAMVRVSTPYGTGAGFFIAGPDEFAYVATAYHVIEHGDRVLVERDVELSDKQRYVEAYPDTEIVASDPDADLAIVRIKNVQGNRFARLPLAKEPIKDEKILSYGYPGSNLVSRAGLVSKDGKILSIVTFPAYDARYDRVIRDNAVDGLLISTDIEPGFSGGPTCNGAGRVVGVNVTKDRAHVGQNGAVSVVALRKLLDTVKPARTVVDLKPEAVVSLLERLERECLLLPVDDRTRVRETEFLDAADLPKLRRFVGEIRREERNSDTAFNTMQLSGPAALGIYFARLPGRLLETYRSPTTTATLARCELANQRLASFLGELGAVDRKLDDRPVNAVDSCDDLAMRPLAWDLAAATVQWDGKERDYTVTKLDKMDDEGKTYRASVRISGATNLVEIWIGIDQGVPRLKLFDARDSVYAIHSPRSTSSATLQGTWLMKRPRVTDAIDKGAEVESDETVSISITDDRHVSIRHVVTERYFGAGQRPLPFKCNRKNTVEVGLLQSFTGTLDNGVVIGLPEKAAERVGADAGNCTATHRADRIIAVKLVGDQLYLYRTDGFAYPETVQLTKQ